MQGKIISQVLINMHVKDIWNFFFNSLCTLYEILSLNLFSLMYTDNVESTEGLQQFLDELTYKYHFFEKVLRSI